MHYNYHRMYNPMTGRYMQPDPIGVDGGMNIYSYVENNPLNAVDPYGLELSRFPGSAEDKLSLAGYQANRFIMPGYHVYNVHTKICDIGDDRCNQENVFNLLKCFPAPQRFFTPKRKFGIKSGDESFALTVGMVEHWVGNKLIVNSTIKGKHLLNPGVVIREVVEKENSIYVVTTGYGTGLMPNINSGIAGYLVWTIRTDSNIINGIKNE